MEALGTSSVGRRMNILAHIHYFNDEDVIDQSIQSVRAQTLPVDGILLVDNGSTDRTLDRQFPACVEVIRLPSNTWTSGAVITGFTYGLQHKYEWVWILDADSAPRCNALEKLIEFYGTLSSQEQERVQRIASAPHDHTPFHSIRFTGEGCERLTYEQKRVAYQCDATIWSGSLFKTSSIKAIGMPSADYVLDWGEFVYGYEGMLQGYSTYVVTNSVMDHNIGVRSPSHLSEKKVGWVSFQMTSMPAIRLYYLVRNTIFFWSYVYRHPQYSVLKGLMTNTGWIPKYLIKLSLLRRFTVVRACLRGLLDGISRRIDRRY